MKNLKAQAWGLDLIVALLIFSVGIMIFYLYSLNLATSKSDLEDLRYDGNHIAETLLSEGYPISWSTTDVENIGLMTENKINSSKVERFFILSEANYDRTKILFDTNFDYFVFFSDNITTNSGEISGIGKRPEDSLKSIIKITRFTTFNDQPINLYLEIWKS